MKTILLAFLFSISYVKADCKPVCAGQQCQCVNCPQAIGVCVSKSEKWIKAQGTPSCKRPEIFTKIEPAKKDRVTYVQCPTGERRMPASKVDLNRTRRIGPKD